MLPPLVAVEVHTRYLPPVTLDVPDPRESPDTSAPGVGSRVLALLRPRLVVRSPFGTQTSAPYGEPGPSQWGTVRLALGAAVVGVLALALVGAASLLRRRGR